MNEEHNDGNFARMKAEAARQRGYAGNEAYLGVASALNAYAGQAMQKNPGLQGDSQRDLGDIFDRICEATAIAKSNSERISLIADRVKGAYPAPCEKTGACAERIGSIGRINDILDQLMSDLSRQSDEIRRIENL